MLVFLGVSAATLMSLQADPARAPRDAFTRCLFTYADAQARERTTLAEFETGFAQQCMAEERAFRDAIRVQQAAMRAPAAEIEEMQTMEVEDARANTKARFEDAITPR